MPSFAGSALFVRDPFVDPGGQILKPTLTRIQQRQFAKLALQHVPGARETFNQVFARPQVRGGWEPLFIPDVGIPQFLWLGK